MIFLGNPNCVKDGGSDAAVLEGGGAGEAGDAAADDGDGGVSGERGSEGDLLLGEALLDDGPPRGAVRGAALLLPPARVWSPLLALRHGCAGSES